MTTDLKYLSHCHLQYYHNWNWGVWSCTIFMLQSKLTQPGILWYQNKTQTQVLCCMLGRGRAAPLGDLLPWGGPLDPLLHCGETFPMARWVLRALLMVRIGDDLGQAVRTAAFLSWGAVVRDCCFFGACWLGWALSPFYSQHLGGPFVGRSCLEENISSVFTFFWQMEIVSHHPVSPLLLRSL